LLCFSTKSLGEKHLDTPQILCKAYNFCSRFWNFPVYLCASPEETLKAGHAEEATQNAGRCIGSAIFGWRTGPLESE